MLCRVCHGICLEARKYIIYFYTLCNLLPGFQTAKQIYTCTYCISRCEDKIVKYIANLPLYLDYFNSKCIYMYIIESRCVVDTSRRYAIMNRRYS